MTAQLYQKHEQHHHRYRLALGTLLTAEKETNDLIKDVEAALNQHEEAGKALKQRARSHGDDVEVADENHGVISEDKGKARAVTVSTEGEDNAPKNAAMEEHAVKKRALQQRLRECQITLHKVYFLQGDVYHVLERTNEETVAYGKAEDLRRVLLRSMYLVHLACLLLLKPFVTGTEQAAKRAMDQLATEMGGKRLTEKELMIEVPYLGAGGIRSNLLVCSPLRSQPLTSH